MLDPLFERDPSVITWPNIEGPPLTDEMVAAAEHELGVTLPQSYVELMRTCNGGYTHSAAFPTDEPTSWAPDHVSVRDILGIPAVGAPRRDLVGDGILKTAYMIEEWEMPQGIVLLSTEGHTSIALDYRASGPAGPPTVAWIDVEMGEEAQLAETFEAFVAALVPESTFPDDDV